MLAKNIEEICREVSTKMGMNHNIVCKIITFHYEFIANTIRNSDIDEGFKSVRIKHIGLFYVPDKVMKHAIKYRHRWIRRKEMREKRKNKDLNG